MLSLFKLNKEAALGVAMYSGYAAVHTASATAIGLYLFNVINNGIQWNRNRKESNN